MTPFYANICKDLPYLIAKLFLLFESASHIFKTLNGENTVISFLTKALS